MAWSGRYLLNGDDRPSAAEMDDLCATAAGAIRERDVAQQLALFGAHAVGALPPDLVPLTDRLAAIAKFQQAVGVSGYDCLVSEGGSPGNWSHWHGPAGGGLLRLVTAASPGAGELNLFQDAGLSATAWRKTKLDPVHIRHPNDLQAVLNRLVRLQTLWSVLAVDGSQYIGHVGADAVWTTARGKGFTLQAPGGGGVSVAPLLGRCGEDWTLTGDYTIYANTSKRATVSFNTAALSAWTLAAAWIALRKPALLSHSDEREKFEDFNFAVKIGATTLRTINSGDAADVAGFRFNYGVSADAWLIPISPVSLVELSGTTTVAAEYADDPLADPTGYLESNVYYSNGWPQGVDVHASLILERANWEYHA